MSAIVSVEVKEAIFDVEVAFHVVKWNYYNQNYKTFFACTCSYKEDVKHTETRERPDYYRACPNCNQENILHFSSTEHEGRINEIVDVISKDDRGFHIRITPITTKISEEHGVHYTKKIEKDTVEVKFNLKDKEFWLMRKDKKYTSQQMIHRYLRDVGFKEILLDRISTPLNKNLYLIAYSRLSMINYERERQITRGLFRLMNYPALEILYFGGFSQNLNSKYLIDVIKSSKKTKPHEILITPKYAMNFLKTVHSSNVIDYASSISMLDETFNGNTVKELLEIFQEDAEVSSLMGMTRRLIQLHQDYNYKDIRKLALYLVRDIKFEQGITDVGNAGTLLADYVRMSIEMNVSYEKFTKDLKKRHDIISMNYKVVESETKNEQFKAMVDMESYQELKYKHNDYSVILPEKPKDLVNEGSMLHHCVSSYVEKVIKGNCKIVFIRKTDEIEKSLLTVEISGNTIRQIRGQSNRSATASEMAFVKLWAEKKELTKSTW